MPKELSDGTSYSLISRRIAVRVALPTNNGGYEYCARPIVEIRMAIAKVSHNRLQATSFA
ncbi:MAG: hypothetical protein M0019_09300 [Actinomycetota bacterium]|nr:hypothetical protein [Actinomycetota bacterium]